MDYIQLKKRKDILRLGIKDEEGNVVKDEYNKEVCIEFNLGDIDLPIKYNKCVKLIEEARVKLKNQIFIIEKKQDHKGKGLLSKNEEDKVKAVKQFYNDMEIAMNLFLGESGTKKYLNGREPYWEMFDELSEGISPYLDKMKIKVSDMIERIEEKYKVSESDVLKNE